MKIDKNKYPILKSLLDKRRFASVGFGFPPNCVKHVRENLDKFTNMWDDNFIKSTHPIYFLSQTVVDIFDGRIDVALKLWAMRDEVKECSGVLLLSNKIYYIYKIVPEEKVVGIMVWQLVSHVVVASFAGFWQKGVKDALGGLPSGCFTAAPNELRMDYPCQMVVTFELFKQYAELETKLLKPKAQIKQINCVYQNTLDFPVTIIDSTWFTTLIKSDAFKVRGHFRLQPYGEGMKQRKLIWINDFMKEGYTREAKILQENPAHS